MRALFALLVFAMPAVAQQGELALSGPEATGVQLAVSDFLRHGYSASGDLSHYTVRVARHARQLEITFVPDTEPRGAYPGGGTAYGPDVYYYVALHPPRILKHLFGQ